MILPQKSHVVHIFYLVYASMCLYLLVFAYIWWENICFKKWHIGTYNSACICLYDVYMSYVFVFSMSWYVSVCMFLSLYVCVCIHLCGHVSACITYYTQVMYTIILGIFSITNIILEVILVHICMYLFILTCISHMCLYMNVSMRMWFIYICICAIHYICNHCQEGGLRGSGSSVLLQV